MNVQWNSEQDFQGRSPRRPQGSPGMTYRRQTGQIRTASVFTVQRQTRQLQADKVHATPPPLFWCEIDRGFIRTPFSTAISSALLVPTSIDYQVTPQISGSEHDVCPEDYFPGGKPDLPARGT